MRLISLLLNIVVLLVMMVLGVLDKTIHLSRGMASCP